MKEITKTRQVEYTIYQTSDGKEFNSRRDAQHHEDLLKGSKKECSVCHGKGRVNERYITSRPTMFERTNERYLERKISDICPECNGNGFLELKWV